MISIVRNYSNANSPISHKYLNHGTLIELIWTITPALILILIAFPSFKLLYLMDEVSDPAMSVLAEGHQWYWSYQYPDFLNADEEFIEFDSYLVPESDLEEGGLRMLEVDNRVIIPEPTHVRFIVTAADVIHSFTCPALGIKYDGYPGRLNQVSVLMNPEGVFYGQCSEIKISLPGGIIGDIMDVDWKGLLLIGWIPLIIWYLWYKEDNKGRPPLDINLKIFGAKIGDKLHNCILDTNDYTGRQLDILYGGHPSVRFVNIVFEGQNIRVAYDIRGVSWTGNLHNLIRLRDNPLSMSCVRDFPSPDIDRWYNLITYRGLVLTSRGLNGLEYIFPRVHHGTIMVHGTWETYLSPIMHHLAHF